MWYDLNMSFVCARVKQSHISSIIECGVILKLEILFLLSNQSFWLDSSIRLETISLVLSM